MTDPLQRVMVFLDHIGLTAVLGSPAPGSFTSGVEIRDGALVVSPLALCSSVLHEAAHLALLPRRWRHQASGDVAAVIEQMYEQERPYMLADPDSARSRALLNCSDQEATAWAWAAGRHLWLHEDQVVCDEEYSGDGASVRLALKMGAHPGIHGLVHGGWCLARQPFGVLRRPRSSTPVYPRLVRWLQA